MFTPDEIARLTGRSPELIRRWVRCERIPAVRIGRRVLIRSEHVPMIEAMPRHPQRRPSLAA